MWNVSELMRMLSIIQYSFLVTDSTRSKASSPLPIIRPLFLAGFNGDGMPVIFLAAEKITEIVKEEKRYGQTGRSRLSRTSQEGFQSSENKINISSVN